MTDVKRLGLEKWKCIIDNGGECPDRFPDEIEDINCSSKCSYCDEFICPTCPLGFRASHLSHEYVSCCNSLYNRWCDNPSIENAIMVYKYIEEYG